MKKFLPLESIGKWCCRIAGWQTGVADDAFVDGHYLYKCEGVEYDEDLER